MVSPILSRGGINAITDVKALQVAINALALPGVPKLAEDGLFGSGTEDAVEAVQRHFDLYDDGIAGPMTLKALGFKFKKPVGPQLKPSKKADPKKTTAKVDCDKHKDGYDRFTVRSDVAERLQAVIDEVHSFGGIITSAGGLRSLNAKVTADRAAASLHYLGRAVDLSLSSGMGEPISDPYLIVLDDKDRRLWRVYAKAPGGEVQSLPAWTYHGKVHQVVASVVDLTAVFEKNGFRRIPARKSFFVQHRATSAEWWHGEDRTGLLAGVSTFGEELQRVWPANQLVGSPPWRLAHYVWNGSRFEAPS